MAAEKNISWPCGEGKEATEGGVEGWGGGRGVSVCVLMTLQKPEEAAGEESPCSQTNDLFLCSRRRGKKVRRRERGRDLRGDTRWRGVRVRAIKTYLG